MDAMTANAVTGNTSANVYLVIFIAAAVIIAAAGVAGIIIKSNKNKKNK